MPEKADHFTIQKFAVLEKSARIFIYLYFEKISLLPKNVKISYNNNKNGEIIIFHNIIIKFKNYLKKSAYI